MVNLAKINWKVLVKCLGVGIGSGFFGGKWLQAKCLENGEGGRFNLDFKQSMAVIVDSGQVDFKIVANGVFVAKDLVVFLVDQPEIVDALRKKQVSLRTANSIDSDTNTLELDVKILEYDPETSLLVVRVGSTPGSVPAKISPMIPSIGSEYISASFDAWGEFQLSKTFTIEEFTESFRDRQNRQSARHYPSLVSYRSSMNGRLI